MKKTDLLLVAISLFSGFSSFAQQDSIPIKGNLVLSGYADVYYEYNFNDPKSGINGGRVFDLKHNQFALGLVQTKLTYTKGKLTGVADLTFGPNADLGNFGNSGTARIIKQAYISYAFTDNLTFTIGQYGTHIGYELIDAPLNFNYSLSYLFGNGPFYHTGAKADLSLGDHIGLMAGVVNGWDALSDFNDKKSITAQISIKPRGDFSLYLNWIGGDEYGGLSAFGNYKGSYTSLFDLTTSFQASDAFLIGLNAAYGSFQRGSGDPGKDAVWGGAALYLDYYFGKHIGLGLRGEYFSDPDGVRYFGPLEVTALTLTGNIKLIGGSLLIKPELRMDLSQHDFFADNDAVFNPATSSYIPNTKSQITGGIAVMYVF